MKEISDKAVEEFRRIIKKDYGKKLDEKDAREIAELFLNLFSAALKYRLKRSDMRLKLKKFPHGYQLTGYDGMCDICRSVKPDETLWFDKTGVKCRPCYMMFKRRAIPEIVAKDRSSWYSSNDLEYHFGLTHGRQLKLEERGELIPRIMKGTGFRVFIKKENPFIEMSLKDKDQTNACG
jgi:hypothetical protein